MDQPLPPVKNPPLVISIPGAGAIPEDAALESGPGASGGLDLVPPAPLARPRLLPHQLLAGVEVGTCVREYSPNETIFFQGDPANSVFYIERGEVKLGVVSRGGKQAIVDILGESSFFGEGCLAGEPVRVVTAIAVRETTVIRLEKRVLLGLFHRSPSVAEEFISQLASRNLRMQADLADHIFNSSEKRLARLLLNMAKGRKRQGGLIPHVTQETLAEMVGTTRPRISFFLNRFRECGFVSYNRNALQVHRSLLTVLSPEKRNRPPLDRNPRG
jgi:CRP/FNR family cyclic AMP-dependent transcriptional regulator